MRVVVGIDPGVETGLAIYRNGVLDVLRTLHPLDIAAAIEELKPSRVVFEDSRLTSHLFTTSANGRIAKKKARNVGQVDMVCALIVEICDRRKVPAHGISPKGKGAKLDAAAFQRVTGWPCSSNQHTRDAAMVAWPFRTARA